MSGKTTLSRAALMRTIQDKLSEIPECSSAKIGPIIERDAPGQWIVTLQGNPSGLCLRSFLNMRRDLQDEFEVLPFQRTGRE